MILGLDFSVLTYSRPGGWAHEVNVNGNHRSVAIRAAGFPRCPCPHDRAAEPVDA